MFIFDIIVIHVIIIIEGVRTSENYYLFSDQRGRWKNNACL